MFVSCLTFFICSLFWQWQANVKLNEQQLATLSSPKAVNEFLENQRENIINLIKQNLAVGDIFKRENLQVMYIASNFWHNRYDWIVTNNNLTSKFVLKYASSRVFYVVFNWGACERGTEFDRRIQTTQARIWRGTREGTGLVFTSFLLLPYTF